MNKVFQDIKPDDALQRSCRQLVVNFRTFPPKELGTHPSVIDQETIDVRTYQH